MLELIHAAAYRTGFGARIALGTRAMAAEIGSGTESFAMHAKGMEIGGYDPRGAKGMALVYGCGPRGGCHHAGGYTVTAELTNPADRPLRRHGQSADRARHAEPQCRRADSAGTCAFLTIGMQDDTLAEALAAATGRLLAAADIYLTGERVNALERVINVREGLRAAGDAILAAAPAKRR